jgi:hypothetical protein
MYIYRPWLVAAAALLAVLGSGLALPSWADEDLAPEGQLIAIRLNLEVLARQVARILSEPPLPATPGPELNAVVNKFEAIDHKLIVLERRLGQALDVTADAHVAQPEESLDMTLEALSDVQDGATGIRDQIGEFLEVSPPQAIPPDLRDALIRVRDTAGGLLQKADLNYYAIEYKRNIPVRFVQFFEDVEQILSDEQLEQAIQVTNRVFQSSRLRFHLWKNLSYYSPNFAHLLDENDDHIPYAWPADLSTSPLLKWLDYPDSLFCELRFVRPTDNVEPRWWAQMRAGTYCAPVGEILVYVNQGFSNGGQYPWYSRIIGMTRNHVLRYTFQHEVGHYLGLPHTFPWHEAFSLDYSFGRMIGTVPGQDLSTQIRRYYAPFEHLLNPQTGGWAKYSDFWDLVFKPSATGEHLFFHSRAAAAAEEPDLQPIEQLASGVICRPYDPDCAVASPVTLLQMTVAGGCKGQPRDFSDCDSPPVNFYTGDPEGASFSRFGSTPDTIELNVMAYYYPWADGTRLPGWVVEDVFLTRSQVEQIDRVMTWDIPTLYSYLDHPIYGLRPELNLCSMCH